MSAVSTRVPKKADPLNKKVPENPKYSHVKSTLDTGSSITKYMEKLQDKQTNYKFKKDEIFKRMKVTTFVQLLLQVAQFEEDNIDNGLDHRPDTADLEVRKIQGIGGGEAPSRASLAPSDADFAGTPAPAPDSSRSTLQRVRQFAIRQPYNVIRGVGEFDIENKPSQPPQRSENSKVLEEGCPYLLLDVREADDYHQCRIISSQNFPKSMLSRACNFETKAMLAYKNQPGKIILVYDEDERLAPLVATTLIQRGYDNMFMLSGGMKVAYKIFPEGLFTGTPSQIVTESPKPSTEYIRATKHTFDQSDLNNLTVYLDNALADKSSGSRLSKASTTSSRMGQHSQRSMRSTATSGQISGRAPFK